MLSYFNRSHIGGHSRVVGASSASTGRSNNNVREKIENGKEDFVPYFCIVIEYK